MARAVLSIAGERRPIGVDTWALLNMGAGGALAALRRDEGWRMVVGRTGMGWTVGVVGYMIWRHGVKGGKWEDN